jgi:hypothetical protein
MNQVGTPAHALLPDPQPRAIRVPIISVHDHLIEASDLFEGRLPGQLADEELRAIAAGNAARQFGHPLPDDDDWRRP